MIRTFSLLVARGLKTTVECVVRLSGEIPARDFLEHDLQLIREKGKDGQARCLALFQQMADAGKLSPKRFKKEMGTFFAFRVEVRNKQIRFVCFQDANKWILTHGFIKPGAQKGKGTWPASEIKRAEDIMAEYFIQKK